MVMAGPSLRYVAASLALGLIAVWGSENLFWTTPAAPVVWPEWLATWAAYSLSAATALSAVLWTGVGGWRAAFLGGAILGFCVEGVVVATMYDAFPVQIVWTPLAWHALLTGLAVLCAPRALARGGIAPQVAFLLLLGLSGAVWGLYWPSERETMPGYTAALGYLAGFGLTVVAAHLLLDRLGSLSPPRPAVLAVAPALLAAGWVARLAFGPSPVLLACPAMVAATVWIMWRLGRRGTALSLAPAAAPWRHALFLIAPVVVALLAVTGWRAFGAVAVNIPIALASGAAGLGLWLWLLAAALRRGKRA
jgi:hypothetical protein